VSVTRDDVLRELKLAPVWRLRRSAASSADVRDIGSERQPELRHARIATLAFDALVADIAECRACGLSTTRRRTVPGVGARDAAWMFVGEAPGADEDAQGEPFVGRAGQLLTSMLKAIGLERSQVYIANILKCRPPGNRDPKPEEAAHCTPYLERQIELIAPRIILVVGRIAAQTLLQTDTPIGRMRGRLYSFGPRATPVVVTYHPAYLLRSPGEKRKAWSDLLFAQDVLARGHG
jgi:DNA polymerase